MRHLWALLLAGCTTVEHSIMVEETRGREQCDSGDLVASVFPADWPNVTIEVLEQRLCSTQIEQKHDVRREFRISRDIAHGIGAGLGAAAGLGAMIALQKLQAPASSTTFNQGDGWLMLPLAGAAIGSTLVEGLNLAGKAQTLPGEVRIESSWVRRNDENPHRTGLLSHGATPLAELRDGRARLPLELAMSVYGRPMKLDGRLVDWSVRASAWVPGRLPACVRAAEANDAAKRAGGWSRFSVRDLGGAELDAEACIKDGWPFATTMLGHIAQECRDRGRASCKFAQ